MSRKISLGIYNSSGGRVFSIIRCLPFLISIFFSSEIIGLFRLDDIAKVENVKSVNDFNYIVVVGPFQNRSQTNNAREDFRRLNMDSLPPKCREINDELRSIP